MLEVRHIFIRQQQLQEDQEQVAEDQAIRQTKRAVQSLPIHHCHCRIIVVHRILAIHSRCMCIRGLHQMW